MYDFGFFLKTYKNDYDRAECLVDSFKKYNEDLLPLFIACPKKDMILFERLKSDNISLICEEDICQDIFHEDGKWSAGYLNQEIYKLAFWELELCENYMCIDSDALFIRPFYKKDFMYDDETPYTSLEEDNDLRSDYYYSRLYWNGRMEWIRRIEDEMDYHPYHLLTCHGFQIFSSRVLKSLKNDFMKIKGYGYKDLIEIAPYEFSWYNFWLQKNQTIELHQVECMFKCFHLKQHHIACVLSGMKIEDWAKGYIGIIVNSNYGVGKGDYYDLSIYRGDNADIPDDIIEMNYRFYKRLRKERVQGLPKRLILMLKDKAKGAISYVRKRG